MAIEVTLPRQGWSMEEAAFVEWLKKEVPQQNLWVNSGSGSSPIV